MVDNAGRELHGRGAMDGRFAMGELVEGGGEERLRRRHVRGEFHNILCRVTGHICDACMRQPLVNSAQARCARRHQRIQFVKGHVFAIVAVLWVRNLVQPCAETLLGTDIVADKHMQC
eukprot:6778322-Prymnesium_polylepis.1